MSVCMSVFLSLYTYINRCESFKSSQADKDTLIMCKQMRFIFFVATMVTHTLLPFVLQCLGQTGQILSHYINFSAYGFLFHSHIYIYVKERKIE